MSGPAQLLRELEGQARKRFGQHFLASAGVVSKIVRVAQVQPGDRVLEVGPGLGVLTEALLRAGADVTAIELDRDLIDFLTERLPEVRLIEGDATQVDLDSIISCKHKVVANLPYNVGTKIITQMIARPDLFESLVVMVQKEVAQRLVAKTGDRKRGSLSVFVEARAEARIRIKVPPGAFHPPPKVHSAVVELILHPEARTGGVDIGHFDTVVRTACSAPRKTIRNALRSQYDAEVADAALLSASIDPRARASTLDLEAFQRLAAALVLG
jgi:16S rRNA (adenine1518-N6/adenine1519-N6)-dimethyltransferase